MGVGVAVGDGLGSGSLEEVGVGVGEPEVSTMLLAVIHWFGGRFTYVPCTETWSPTENCVALFA